MSDPALPLTALLAVAQNPLCLERCQLLAQALNVPLLTPGEAQLPYRLVYAERGLQLEQTGPKAPGPIRIDFAEGASEHRRKHGGAELIVKAIAGDKKQRPSVLDMTAGLGRDSFVLAARGYPVTLCERSPVVAALLQDALQRAEAAGDEELASIVSRMQLVTADVRDFLRGPGEQATFDAVMIDPMFPSSKKSALVKKEMQAFHQLVGADEDSDELLALALSIARHRVVVKRPRKAEPLAGKAPNYAVEGKAIRFDIYSLRAYGK